MVKWRLRLFWALLLALFTVWAVRAHLLALEEREPLVLAAREIPARAQVTPDMLRTVSVKRSDLAQLSPDAYRSPEQLVGRYARRAIPAGEILRDRPGDFTDEAVRPAGFTGQGALADFLPPDTRAVSVKVDPEGVTGGHIRPGDRVDLVFTSKSDSTGGVYASLVVQQVMVLSLEPLPDSPEVMVTLLVSLDQAVRVALAKRTGAVDLVLNPPEPGVPSPLRAISPLAFTGQGQ